MKSKEYRNTQILANLVCGILALLALLPFILLIVASLTDNTWATANGFSFFPGSWSLDAYRYIAVQWATIGRAYLMTIVVTIIGSQHHGDDSFRLCHLPAGSAGHEAFELYDGFYHAF